MMLNLFINFLSNVFFKFRSRLLNRMLYFFAFVHLRIVLKLRWNLQGIYSQLFY